MEKISVFCLSISRPQADQVLSQLKIAGFFSSEISVLFHYQGATSPRKPPLLVAEGSTTAASDPAIIRGTVGWLAGTVQFAFPDGGPLIAAGPILGALIAASGVVGSGLASGIMALGVPELVAARYGVAIRAGNILVSTQTTTPTEIDVAWEVLHYAQAQDICLAQERGSKLNCASR